MSIGIIYYIENILSKNRTPDQKNVSLLEVHADFMMKQEYKMT